MLGPVRTWSANGTQRLLSCRSDHQGKHYLCLFDSNGKILFDHPLPGRGHAIALSPDHTRAAVFARRPGDFIVVIDLESLAVATRITARPDRHFYGHGVFTHDGRWLLATENAFESGMGCIGIYDTGKQYDRIGELDSHGVGPHELMLLGNSDTLVIANGGIKTHPDFPRAKLNLDSMRSTLAYVDLSNGQLLSKHSLPSRWHQLSMRHIDITSDGLVAVAMQFEGAPTQHPPLVALHRQGGELQTVTAPKAVQRRMRNYCGSVTFIDDGRSFAVSSPRGNLVTHWDNDGNYLDHFEQRDVCGIASDSGQTWYSDGHGGLRQDSGNGSNVINPLNNNRWDNHLIVM